MPSIRDCYLNNKPLRVNANEKIIEFSLLKLYMLYAMNRKYEFEYCGVVYTEKDYPMLLFSQLKRYGFKLFAEAARRLAVDKHPIIVAVLDTLTSKNVDTSNLVVNLVNRLTIPERDHIISAMIGETTSVNISRRSARLLNLDFWFVAAHLKEMDVTLDIEGVKYTEKGYYSDPELVDQRELGIIVLETDMVDSVSDENMIFNRHKHCTLVKEFRDMVKQQGLSEWIRAVKTDRVISDYIESPVFYHMHHEFMIMDI